MFKNIPISEVVNLSGVVEYQMLLVIVKPEEA